MNRTDPGIAIALALVAALVWAPGLHGSFQFDDWNVVVDEPRVQSLAAWWQSMPGIRPILKLTYALNNQLGSDAAGFRAVNIAFHACNTALVYLCLLGFSTAHVGLSARWRGRLAAAIAAALFALHPVQSDAVTYIAGRSSVLSAFFSLLALVLWHRHARRIEREPDDRWWRVPWAALLCFALALGSKENALALPLIVGLLWLTSTPPRIAAQERPGLGVAVAPFLLVTLLLLLIAATLTPYPRLIALASEGRPALANLLSQANGVSYLLGQVLLVRPPNADPALPHVMSLDVATALRATLLLTILATGCLLLRRRPAIAFGILWFFIWLAPTNSLLPRVDVVFERQAYLALAGPAWLLGWSIASLRMLPVRLFGAAVAAAAVVLFGQLTLARHAVYADEISFWQDVSAKSPASARAANNLGMAYAAACRTRDALAEFARAARLDPADPFARINSALLQRGELPAGKSPCGDTPRSKIAS